MMSLLDSIVENMGSGAKVIGEKHDLNQIDYGGDAAVAGAQGSRPSGNWDEREYGISLTEAQKRWDDAQTPEARAKVIAELKQRAIRRAGLDVSNGRVNVMVAGKLPWHGLGVNISKACTWEEAAQFSHTNYNISKRALYYDDATGTKRQSQSAWSIVRDDTGEELGSVGNRYKIIQNADAFKFLDSVIGEFGARFESAGALYNGSHVFGLVHLPKQSFTVNGGDKQEAFAMFMNVHDGSGSAWCFPTSVRAVCANTANTAMKDKHKGLSIRHTGDVKDKVSAAREALGYAVKGIEEYKEQAEVLYAKPLEITHYANDVLDAVLDITQAQASMGADVLAASIARTQAEIELAAKSFAKKIERREEILADILERYESERCGIGSIRGTAWAAWNAVTEHVDHAKIGRQAQDVQTRASRRFESVLMGDGAEMKQTALEIALKA